MTPPYGLARILSHEAGWSDLICYLAEQDPDPLRRLLTLGHGNLVVHREYPVRGGLLDVLVMAHGTGGVPTPKAVLEIKLGASLHADQLERYGRWATNNGLPSLHLVGPDHQRIRGTPKNWSTAKSLPDIVGAWAEWSSHPVASSLAREARQLFVDIQKMAVGPASASFGVVPDLMRIRRIYAAMETVAQSLRITLYGDRSSAGFPNFAASYTHPTTGNRAWCEIQRIDRGRGTFELRLMVGTPDGELVQSERLAKRHHTWLLLTALAKNLPPAVTQQLHPVKGSEFKTRRSARGSALYYGYVGEGQGGRFALAPNITLSQMRTLTAAVLTYLSGFTG
jgi:hypothetical protein